MEPWDPGLQPERTALAWRRTAIAIATTALVVLRLAVAHGTRLGGLAALLALAVAAETIRRSSLGYSRAAQRLRSSESLRPLADPRLLTAGVLVLSASAIVTALG